MKTRTALVACVEATAGVWTVIKGNEEAVHIQKLVDGERVVLHLQGWGATPDKKYFYPKAGTHPVDFSRYRRYRVGKLIRPLTSPQPTTVEIVLNGKAADTRDVHDSQRGSGK